jgi:hypothetical protein
LDTALISKDSILQEEVLRVSTSRSSHTPLSAKETEEAITKATKKKKIPIVRIINTSLKNYVSLIIRTQIFSFDQYPGQHQLQSAELRQTNIALVPNLLAIPLPIKIVRVQFSKKMSEKMVRIRNHTTNEQEPLKIRIKKL